MITLFVQSDEKKTDGMTSLQNRAYSDEVGLGKDIFNAKKTTPDSAARLACEKWFDVRSFGQLFAFKAEGKGKKKDAGAEESKDISANGVSIAIRGPVTIQSAFSVNPVSITSTQITKSVSGEGDGSKKGSAKII